MKVLVATDGSEKAMKAVHRALDMARDDGAWVTILSVACFINESGEDMPPGIQARLEREAQAALDRARAVFIANNVSVRTVLQTGPVAADNIIDFAREGHYGCIVLGTSNIHGFRRFLKASTAARVASYAPCEVVIVA